MKQHVARTSENGVLLRPASLEEAGLFYSELDAEQDKVLGIPANPVMTSLLRP